MVLGLLFGIFYIFADFLYWAKWLASYVALRYWKMTHPRRFDLYDFEVTDNPEKVGFLVPEVERVLESPCSEEHLQESADEVLIFGANSKSECLVLRLSRACEDKAEAWIYLKLADGRRYMLQESAGHQRNYGDSCTTFSCGGLQMYYMSPMRRWRIVYCGMLNEIIDDKISEKQSVFVKFSFLWTASSEVFDTTSDLNVKPTAEAIARAKWNSPFPPINKCATALNYYSQSGVITGIVSVEDKPDAELYLFGGRLRHLANSFDLVGCKFKQIFGFVPENGLVMQLGQASIPNIFHKLPFGFIVHPAGNLYPIEDGLIISKMNESKASGKSLTAMFKARKQYDLTGGFKAHGIRFASEHGWGGHLELHEVEFEVGNFKGSGILLIGEIKNVPERKILKIPSAFPKDKPLTVYFTDDISHLPAITGGKGSSLGKLTKLSNQIKSQFIVPKGIVVTTTAYMEFLNPEIHHKIENLKNVVYGNVKGDVQEACKMVTSAIEKSILPAKITREIEEKLNYLFDGKIKDHRFAVRSSATGEDTDQMSAAGQMDTYLGVQGLKEIFTAVKKSWASQFGTIAVEYKRQNGQILNSPMAVVIQEMVNCEASGVLFTCDPVTDNPSVVTITGNYGLGESVVSGSEEPDTIVLQKLPGGEVEIKSVLIGLKEHKIVVQDTGVLKKDSEEARVGETITEDVPENKRKECCITKEMALRLGKLSLKLEDFYKSPRDIEWGVRNNTIYMLQSRPVTTGVIASDYEIKHEFDAPLRCEKEFFAKSNIGEVMPGATSPLGIDVICRLFSICFFRKGMAERQRNNFMQSKYFFVGILPFYNHMMMAAIDFLSRAGDLESQEGESMMMAMCGRVLDDPDLFQQMKYKEYEPMKMSICNQVKFYWNLFFCDIEKCRKTVFSFQLPKEKCKSALETFRALSLAYNITDEPLSKHVIVTEASSMWNMHLMSLLSQGKGGVIDTEVYSDFANLLSTQSNVESAEVPVAMENLAKLISKDINKEKFKAMSVEEAQEWLEKSATLSANCYRKFIELHGHRCLKEFDMHSNPWNEDPKSLIKLLQNLVGTDKKEKEVKDIFSKIAGLKSPMNWKQRLLLKFILPRCLAGVRGRENVKSNLIKSMDNVRKYYQHLSKQMASEGYLPDGNLIYFLTNDEIKDILYTRNPRLISRALHRRKIFPILEEMKFEEIIKGRPVPLNEEDESAFEYEADLTMKGIPVSQGIAKGYARIALTLEEAALLQPGEILITYSTDIGWSPYFPILGGVVTEIGGLISHGAVVSREYGLPCVVGLRGATRKFVTGDYVLIDGSKGILQRITAPNK